MKYSIILLLTGILITVTVSRAQNVGIGTSTPATTAALDISSATKGFLPPRMDSIARNAIVSPATGLTIYNTTMKTIDYWNGTVWVSIASTLPVVHFIGESYGGGIVFYITPNALHGLIAETQDQSTSSAWFDAQNFISDPANHSASGQNYTDWRLPTKNELNLLYLQRLVVGGFVPGYYWNSNESGSTAAWLQYFLNGAQGTGTQNTSYFVRSVRAF